MTQTEQVDIRQRMHEACARFYEAFDCVPERVLVYYGQKPHLPAAIVLPIPSPLRVLVSELEVTQSIPVDRAHIPIEAYTPSKLNWGEFYLYHPKTGRVEPDTLVPSAQLFKKMVEARGYKVLVKSGKYSPLDTFYIFQGDRYISWAHSKFAYEDMYMATFKAELESALKRFGEQV